MIAPNKAKTLLEETRLPSCETAACVQGGNRVERGPDALEAGPLRRAAQADLAFDAKRFVESLPVRPGIYRMFDAKGTLLYVGKAKNLKARVSSYFHAGNAHPKVVALVAKIASMQVTITNSDTEALLLEINLIQEHRPRFNILLRDDKSFPFLAISTHQDYPRLSLYRGSRKEQGRFFGPYPSSSAVRDALRQMQDLFKLRNCEDSYFKNRSRPCLQYQIKRCTAPCVGLISQEDYAQDVQSAMGVLEGRNTEVNVRLSARMEAAAEALNFEEAGKIRDQMAHLKAIQHQQIITSDIHHEADIIALAQEGADYCIALMFVREGRSLGSATFFPEVPFAEPAEVIGAFIAQYYAEHRAPSELIVAERPDDANALEITLSEKYAHKVRIASKVRALRARWLELSTENARQALHMKRFERVGISQDLADLATEFAIESPIRRIECFDISHTMGTDTIASCVVFDEQGAAKREYRRFNITGIEPGDDYAAMHQALTRRYTRVKNGESPKPDILLIDGGRGQLAQAAEVLATLELSGVCLIGVAKGPDRKPGQEQLFSQGIAFPRRLAPESRVLHLIQRIRDEAHRFAITGHRQKRAKHIRDSALDAVPGLGPVKRREILKALGGLQGIKGASMEDFSSIKGIGLELARSIYQYLHPDA